MECPLPFLSAFFALSNEKYRGDQNEQKNTQLVIFRNGILFLEDIDWPAKSTYQLRTVNTDGSDLQTLQIAVPEQISPTISVVACLSWEAFDYKSMTIYPIFQNTKSPKRYLLFRLSSCAFILV